MLAHRGLALDVPENTLVAFRRAVEAGALHLETDVHATRDGVAVISHDAVLDRVARRPGRIAELTLAELQRIDLGGGETFPTLERMLAEFPTARVNLDIKAVDAVEPAIRALRASGALDRVLVGSFDERRRRAVVDALPGVATSASSRATLAALVAARSGRRERLARLLAEVDALQVPETFRGVRVVSPRTVRAFRSAGVEVHVWTVNEPERMSRLLDWGVDGLVTDRADLAVPLVAARS